MKVNTSHLFLAELKRIPYGYLIMSYLIFILFMVIGYGANDLLPTGLPYKYYGGFSSIVFGMIGIGNLYNSWDTGIIFSVVDSIWNYVIRKYLLYYAVMVVVIASQCYLHLLLLRIATPLRITSELYETFFYVFIDTIIVGGFTQGLGILFSMIGKGHIRGGIVYMSFFLIVHQYGDRLATYRHAGYHTSYFQWILSPLYALHCGNKSLWITNKGIYLLLTSIILFVIYWFLQYSKIDYTSHSERGSE